MKRLCEIWCFCVSRQLCDSSVVWFMYVKEGRERERQREMGKLCSEDFVLGVCVSLHFVR